jgi:hypothetical protein
MTEPRLMKPPPRGPSVGPGGPLLERRHVRRRQVRAGTDRRKVNDSRRSRASVDTHVDQQRNLVGSLHQRFGDKTACCTSPNLGDAVDLDGIPRLPHCVYDGMHFDGCGNRDYCELPRSQAGPVSEKLR